MAEIWPLLRLQMGNKLKSIGSQGLGTMAMPVAVVETTARWLQRGHPSLLLHRCEQSWGTGHLIGAGWQSRFERMRCPTARCLLAV